MEYRVLILQRTRVEYLWSQVNSPKGGQGKTGDRSRSGLMKIN